MKEYPPAPPRVASLSLVGTSLRVQRDWEYSEYAGVPGSVSDDAGLGDTDPSGGVNPEDTPVRIGYCHGVSPSFSSSSGTQLLGSSFLMSPSTASFFPPDSSGEPYGVTVCAYRGFHEIVTSYVARLVAGIGVLRGVLSDCDSGLGRVLGCRFWGAPVSSTALSFGRVLRSCCRMSGASESDMNVFVSTLSYMLGFFSSLYSGVIDPDEIFGPPCVGSVTDALGCGGLPRSVGFTGRVGFRGSAGWLYTCERDCRSSALFRPSHPVFEMYGRLSSGDCGSGENLLPFPRSPDRASAERIGEVFSPTPAMSSPPSSPSDSGPPLSDSSAASTTGEEPSAGRRVLLSSLYVDGFSPGGKDRTVAAYEACQLVLSSFVAIVNGELGDLRSFLLSSSHVGFAAGLSVYSSSACSDRGERPRDPRGTGPCLSSSSPPSKPSTPGEGSGEGDSGGLGEWGFVSYSSDDPFVARMSEFSDFLVVVYSDVNLLLSCLALCDKTTCGLYSGIFAGDFSGSDVLGDWALSRLYGAPLVYHCMGRDGCLSARDRMPEIRRALRGSRAFGKGHLVYEVCDRLESYFDDLCTFPSSLSDEDAFVGAGADGSESVELTSLDD